MPYIKISGIYKITNLINKKSYIGSAKSLFARFVTHKNLLKRNKHFNLHLQSSYNKYGINNFKFEILLYCSLEELENKEEFMIQLFRSNNRKFGYNKRLNCETNLGKKFSEETINKLRISHLGHKRSKEAQEKISKSQFKAIDQYDLENNLINTFESIKLASQITKIPSRSISSCCTNKIKTSYGYKWKHKN